MQSVPTSTWTYQLHQPRVLHLVLPNAISGVPCGSVLLLLLSRAVPDWMATLELLHHLTYVPFVPYRSGSNPGPARVLQCHGKNCFQMYVYASTNLHIIHTTISCAIGYIILQEGISRGQLVTWQQNYQILQKNQGLWNKKKKRPSNKPIPP